MFSQRNQFVLSLFSPETNYHCFHLVLQTGWALPHCCVSVNILHLAETSEYAEKQKRNNHADGNDIAGDLINCCANKTTRKNKF